MEFKDKFIGFVDILGFKQLVEAMEAGQAVPLAELLGMLASPLGRTPSGTYHWVCPASSGVQRDLDFQVTQISDCVVVSSEISPPGIINLIDHCWTAVSGCMHKGVMCRGYITRGSIYHTPMQFVAVVIKRLIQRNRRCLRSNVTLTKEALRLSKLIQSCASM